MSNVTQVPHAEAAELAGLYVLDALEAAEREAVAFPVSGVSVGLCGMTAVVLAAVEDAGDLKDAPRDKFRAIPRAAMIRLVLRHEGAEAIFFADVHVAAGEMHELIASGLHRRDDEVQRG